jgi:hypothetical protein
MGWDSWPNPNQEAQALHASQQDDMQGHLPLIDDAPLLIPLQPKHDNADPVDEVIQNIDALGGLLDAANAAVEHDNGEVLAMDDLTDESEVDPPLPTKPIQIVDFPNFDNLQPLMLEEIQL